MTSDAPVGALDRVLLRTCHLLIDFDGPVCSLFAGTPTATIAARLRTILTREGVALPPAVRNTGNWFEIFAFAAMTGPALASQIESELAALESAAARTAVPTLDLADVLSACHESGRQACELGTVPSACAVIGDSPSDIAAARSAGASSIGYAATSGGTRQLLSVGADAIITTMADLASRIRGEDPESPHVPLPRPVMASHASC
jgi:hypothetical protein